MKVVLILLMLLVVPFVSSYSAGDFFDDGKDFFGDYFALTGSVIVKLTEKITDLGGGNFESIHPSEEYVFEGCIDNDRGNFKFKGTCEFEEKKFVDYCSEDRVMVYEYSCNSGCAGSWYLCEDSCLNGACI
ncbi:hypothetical protein HN865_04855 [Candidatus Woesearchaeota archaeon]|jgi:hypothetical protein|nr:hypothetical protein [Candidatus Woesearchaeota archaeon]MBT7238153.1 hypothetical protein [Candidatus Woesearchaeota archaeon]